MKQQGKLESSIGSALYARKSSDQPAHESAIDNQVSLLCQRIEADGGIVDESLFFIDDGIGGSTLARPGLERLRAQAAAGAIGRLYVLEPDRLARQQAHQRVLVEELRACHAEIVFVNPPPVQKRNV